MHVKTNKAAITCSSITKEIALQANFQLAYACIYLTNANVRSCAEVRVRIRVNRYESSYNYSLIMRTTHGEINTHAKLTQRMYLYTQHVED